MSNAERRFAWDTYCYQSCCLWEHKSKTSLTEDKENKFYQYLHTSTFYRTQGRNIVIRYARTIVKKMCLGRRKININISDTSSPLPGGAGSILYPFDDDSIFRLSFLNFRWPEKGIWGRLARDEHVDVRSESVNIRCVNILTVNGIVTAMFTSHLTWPLNIKWNRKLSFSTQGRYEGWTNSKPTRLIYDTESVRCFSFHPLARLNTIKVIASGFSASLICSA